MSIFSNYKGIIVLFLSTIVLAAIILSLPPEPFEMVIRENGPVEMMTAIGYMAAALWLYSGGLTQRISHGYSSGTIALLLGLRELDFHCRFTTMGIFKTRFFISEKVPFAEKIIVTIILLLLFAGLAWYTKKYFALYIRELKRGNYGAISVAMAIILAAVTKFFDRMAKPINALMQNVFNLDSAAVIRVAEETFELAIPFYLILAIHQNLSSRKTG